MLEPRSWIVKLVCGAVALARPRGVLPWSIESVEPLLQPPPSATSALEVEINLVEIVRAALSGAARGNLLVPSPGVEQLLVLRGCRAARRNEERDERPHPPER